MHNKHDLLSKDLFSNPDMVEQLIKDFVPQQIWERLDFTTLKSSTANYITPSFVEKKQDIVWSVQLISEARQQPPITVYVYILLEFQSEPDKTMPLRMLHYTASFYNQLIKEEKLNLTKDKLPPVLPLVIYSGARVWKVPLQIQDLIHQVPGFLLPYQINQRYFLLDENRISDRELKQKKQILSRAMLVKKSRSGAEMLHNLTWLQQHPDIKRFEPLLMRWLKYYLAANKLNINLEQDYSLQEVLDMSTTLYEAILEEGKQDGLQVGLIKGKAEGIQVGLLKGKEEGKAEGLLDAAAKMLCQGFKVEEVANILDLPMEQVQELQRNN